MRSLVRTASRTSARTTTPASAAWAAVLTMAVLCAGVVAPATSAARVLASGGNSLPLPGYADMAVHDKAGRVYVTAGRSSNALLSVDFRGRVRKVLDRQSGATGLVLSADHGTLYVALSAGDAISAIDTTTFKEVARYPTGARMLFAVVLSARDGVPSLRTLAHPAGDGGR